MAAWQARRLLPGESAEARLALDGEGSVGHHRHIVWIVGEDPETPLGRMLVTADAVSSTAPASAITPRRIDLGRFTPGDPVQQTFRLTNPGAEPLLTRLEGGDPPPRPGEILLAPGETRDVDVTLAPAARLWGQRITFRQGDRAISCEILGVPEFSPTDAADGATSPEAITEARFGDLVLRGLTRLEDHWAADFGLCPLGAQRQVDLEVSNHGAKPVVLDRLFTNGEEAFTTDLEKTRLEPGERGRLTLRLRGTLPPGTFRRFAYLLTDGEGAERIQLACAGVVADPAHLPPDPAVRRVTLRVERRDDVPHLVVESSSLASVAIAVPGPGARKAGLTEAVCSNLRKPRAVGTRPEVRLTGVDPDPGTRVLSVWGDETLGEGEDQWLTTIEDPGGAVIDALHSDADSDLPVFDGLDVVVFQDALPLAEETARRTRVPAVFVVLRDPGVEKLGRRRGVTLWNPSLNPASRSELVIHTRRGTVLTRELVSIPEVSGRDRATATDKPHSEYSSAQ